MAILSPLQQQRRDLRNLLMTTLVVLVVLGGVSLAAYQYYVGSHTGPTFPGITTTGIGVVQASNGQYIGISNGIYAFDTNRIDGKLKTQAASAFKQGDAKGANSFWHQAIALDTSDAEALIYLEDQQVLASGKPYETLVVGTMLTGDTSAVSTGRDNLQGAYIAQKEWNDGSKLGNTQVYLLIASAGGSSSDTTKVAQQVVQAAKHDTHIIGVMGWPYSSYVSASYAVLRDAHIPMVSPAASSDTLSGVSPYFFRIVPPNKTQAVAGALYAEKQLHVSRAVVFVDANDPYSQSLATAFQTQFEGDGNKIVAKEPYTKGQTANFPHLLQDALTHNPDLIYFAGYAADMSVLLTNFTTSQANVQVLGGDALYQLAGYSRSASVGFEQLRFTAFAYPDSWGYKGRPNPPFFKIYTYNFDPSSTHPGSYGYSRPDADAILSYDATTVLLQGSKNALSIHSSVTPDALKNGLVAIDSAHPIQGISGQISFETNGDPREKAIVILKVDSQGHIMLSPELNAIQGCFQISECH